MPDIAQLGLSIDTRQVVEGSKALDSLCEAAVRVEQKTAGATAAVDRLGEASAGAKSKAAEGATAVDALGDAGARVAPKVAGATTSVDSLSVATARVRSTSTEGVSALDNFSNSSAGVWRRGSDAAKSVEALGDATQRTGQRAAISNGQMDDTSKIMRAQAEQARATAQANTALGNTTTQMTLGQQLFIDKLRDQAAVLGMSRTQLLAYQAAELGVTAQTQDLINKMKQFEDTTRAATEANRAAAAAKRDQERAAFTLSDAIGFLAKAYAALKVAEYVKEMALMAARYETLGVVVQVVGRNAGYTKTQMDTATDSIARQGITMIESRESATKLVQAHVDLKNATVLARIAQDAAVIGHLNSSDAFDRLVNGISRGNVLILRNIGINVNLQTAYRQMADELGKTTKELSENERVQARLNAVIERGSDIAGTYEAAMGTAGKQITSMQRYMTDLKTVSGETFLEVLTVTVMALTKGFKDANGEVNELSRNNQLHEWGSTLAQVFVVVADNVNNAFSAMKLMGAAGTYVSKAADIHTQYTADRSAAGFSITGQIDAYKKMQAAMEANAKLLGDSKDQILAGEDKFQKAYDERVITINSKRKKDADEKLRVDSDYAQRAQALLVENAGKSLKIQQDAQVALANSVYVGTPTYRDTEGREPKPKADQVENTQLADQIKQYAKEAATAKAHYDALGKLDDMYLKGGELSAQQAYENKRSYALKTYEAEVDAYDLQISALQGHNNTTKEEAAKHQKELNEILGKRDAAEKAFFDASFTRDEEDRLRQAAITTSASDAANKEIAAINAQVAAVEEQIRTYGLLPAQKTALAVADLEEQKAALASFEGNEKVIDGINRKIEAMKRLSIVQSKASTQEQGGDVAKAKELLDILTAVDTATKSAAQGMAASFGAVGTAIGGLTTALSGYAVQQQAIAAQLAAATKDAYGDPTKVAKAQAAAAQQGAQAQIKSYGDMASSAKGFFKENTAGYRAMEGAEKAYRAVEMAMAIESMVKKLFTVTAVTTATVGGEAAKAAAVQAGVATQLAADTVKGTSAAAVAVATQAQGDPYSAWIRMAAMAAAMAALGFAVSGGGGSDTTAKDRQAATGTGTVLGDSSAKSESIAHSLAIMEKNSGLGLVHTISMDSSLKQMVAGIGNLASLLARSGVTSAGGGAAAGVQTGTTSPGGGVGKAAFAGLGAYGGALAGGAVGSVMTMGAIGAAPTLLGALGGPLGMAVGAVLGSVLGSVVSKLFNTTTSIKDQGITGKAMSLGDVDALGFTAQAYADVNTKKKAFGISYSSKDSTQTAALSDEMNDQLSMIISSMGQTIRSAADVLGLGGDAFNAKLNTFVVDLGKISLKDLKGEEQQKALETAFSKLGDDMAKFGVAGLQQYQAVGEGYLETLARVANDYMQVSDVLAVLDKHFSATGLAAVKLSEGLIASAGGIDKLTSGTGYFVENFLNEAERMAPITKSVRAAMDALGLGSVKSADEFKTAVLDAADGMAMGAAGSAELYVRLLALAEPFKKTTDYAEALAGGLTNAAKTASEIASERRDLQSQYDELTMTSIQLREKERAAIAVSNLALYDSVIALKDKKAAEEAATAATQAAAAVATGLLSAVDAAFATLQTVVNREKTALARANDIAAKAMQIRIDSETAAMAKHKTLADALKSSLDQMNVSGTMEDMGRASAQAQIAAVLASVKAGGALPAADSLKDALSSVTKDASDKFATYDDYLVDFYRTQNDIAALGKLTDFSLSVEQKTLDLLQAQKDASQVAYEAEVARLDGILETARSQIDVLKGIDTTSLSILQAMTGLASAMAAAQANSSVGALSGINNAYQTALGRAPEKAGMDYWGGLANSGTSIGDIVSGIKNSLEAQAQALYKSVMGRAGDAAGIDYWTNVLAGGSSIDQVRAAMMGSAEYKKLHSFDVGTNYLPSDMLAQVHEGERIIPAADNRELMARLSSPTSNDDALAAEVRELRRENREMRAMMEAHLYAIAKNTLNAADSLEGAANGDMPLTTKKVEETA